MKRGGEKNRLRLKSKYDSIAVAIGIIQNFNAH